ncbi:hypothetical protein O0L34_g14005 [Tuta absoluta]|nr:hypothetical protein O0L34_g14005 [Tuta absoluta]
MRLEKKFKEDVQQSVKIETIKEFMQFHKNVENLMKPVDNIINLKVLVSLVLSFIYTIVILTKYTDILVPKVSFSLHLCYVLLLPCASSIVYELLASELDRMKHMIVKEYTFSTDGKNRRSLRDVLLVWRIRNNRRTIWRLFPLDITLLFNFFSLVTTYSIVVAQFKKLI